MAKVIAGVIAISILGPVVFKIAVATIIVLSLAHACGGL